MPTNWSAGSATARSATSSATPTRPRTSPPPTSKSSDLRPARAEGAAGDDGEQGARLRAVAAGVPRRPDPAGPLLPAPGADARPEVRARPGARVLRRHRAAERRPGRVLQAPVGALLRGGALRAPAAAGGGRPLEPAVVPGLRPDRAAPRPLQSHPHPGSLRTRRLPPLLRGGDRAVRR